MPQSSSPRPSLTLRMPPQDLEALETHLRKHRRQLMLDLRKTKRLLQRVTQLQLQTRQQSIPSQSQQPTQQ
jgi:hypothetical protein